ncbi:osmoprotectant transport system permease protein [Trichococcus patagoniensis]|uniref:Osmoprotectant transport system permease protein n=1 Tax=Trichococcus patagoniensis TaxID=382641 RepID=A0A2T5ICS5_9LACT|nr:ABC transporter permease [Trichococcus patagoniensis]PTQ81622.1 osmoprotectant transport system permease protein [Trichococcus patagoniensis]
MGTTLLIAILIASGVILACIHHERVMNALIYLTSLLYSIPSLALFAILIPLTGLGRNTAIIVLVIYCQYILLRSFATGIREIDPTIIEAAVGMGMTRNQIFRKIQIPLATTAIIAGIRIAATATIGIATIAATINAGGLGTVLFDGLRTFSVVKLLWGTSLSILLSLFVNVILYFVEVVLRRRFS